jgi:hypothetical protein
MPLIEISYTKDEDEMLPEHYGYYHNIDDAKEALDEIAKLEED